MGQMPTEERIALISDTVNYMVGNNTDPESQKFLQNVMKGCPRLQDLQEVFFVIILIGAFATDLA